MNKFSGRQLVIATKHKKEQLIAPVFEESLGVSCFVPDNFDTDAFGTFTGERERKTDPVSTARNKCLQAMELSNADLGIASEGSFGSHPSLFGGYVNEEILVFIDKKDDLEIVGSALSTKTNFNGTAVNTEKQLIAFAERVQFPSHALILREAKSAHVGVIKGIKDWGQLKTSFRQLFERHGSVYAETDMRALNNPSRMKVIKKAAQNLLEKIQSCCPQCKAPGFGVSSANAGLPCRLCGSPTLSVLSYRYTCQGCAFSCEERYPHKINTEDPMFCNNCNP